METELCPDDDVAPYNIYFGCHRVSSELARSVGGYFTEFDCFCELDTDNNMIKIIFYNGNIIIYILGGNEPSIAIEYARKENDENVLAMQDWLRISGYVLKESFNDRDNVLYFEKKIDYLVGGMIFPELDKLIPMYETSPVLDSPGYHLSSDQNDIN